MRFATAIVAALSASSAQAEDLTLCWAAWDPANALVEMSKEFEAASGHTMTFVFAPWPDFTDRMLSTLNLGSSQCDLLIGDSQWIGSGAENGHYVKLNDVFDAEGISMDDFVPAAVQAFSSWPKGTPNYYAVPAMIDAVGWVYRKDWFGDPAIKTAYQDATGQVLREPQSQKELLQIAQFFQGREIDGQTVYGASIFTDSGSDDITMGVTGALYAWGVSYENTPGAYDIQGVVNAPEAVEALEFYKELYRTATPPGYTNASVGDALEAFKSGQVAMAMNWFTFFPGLYADLGMGGEKIDVFVNPPQNQAGSALGGQGLSVVAYSEKQDAALEYIKWFSDPAVQAKWWALGGYSAHTSVLNAPDFVDSQPFAGDLLEAMRNAQDFWREPAHAKLLEAMQKRLHDYIVGDQGSAQEALDKLVEDWTEVFEGEGKL